MNIAKPVAVATALLVATISPALAAWSYSVETDETGLEYARAAVDAPQSGASLYTECTERLDLGLALILGASPELAERLDGGAGQILYMNEKGGTALATVGYAAGENRLTLVAPERKAIEAVWSVLVNAEETVAVRFTFPPEPQVFEVTFPAEGAAEALGKVNAYCH